MVFSKYIFDSELEELTLINVQSIVILVLTTDSNFGFLPISAYDILFHEMWFLPTPTGRPFPV